MAVWVNGKIAGRGFLRLAYFTPTVLPMIAVANIWLFFYTPDYGLLEQITGALACRRTTGSAARTPRCGADGGDRLEGSRLFHDFLSGRAAADVAAARRGGGHRGRIAMLFFPAGDISPSMPTTLFVLVNAVINAFRLVDHVVVMTRGGPDNATELLLYYIYEIGFRFWDSAYAAALTMVLLLLLGAVALLQFWFLNAGSLSMMPFARRAHRPPRWKPRARGCLAPCGFSRWHTRSGPRFTRPNFPRALFLSAPLTLDNFVNAPGTLRRSPAISSIPSCFAR